jgi:hypothetical protein
VQEHGDELAGKISAMDFELPQELRLLKENVRRFVDRELIPLEREVVNDVKAQKELPNRLRGKAQALGLWLYDVPEEFGGLGLGMLAKVIVWSEIGRTTALPSRGVSVFGPPVSPILYQLEGAAREKYLMPVIRGEKRACFAQTEADAGSDPAAMRTTAVRDGDHYVINGVKRFITGADEADFAQVFAVTDPQKRSRGGISAFLVDMDAPGVKVAASYDLMVDDKPCEIMFDHVARADRKSHRQGRRGVWPGTDLDQCRPDSTRSAQSRRDGTLPRACHRVCEAAQDVRRAAGAASKYPMAHRGHADGRSQAATHAASCRLEIRPWRRLPAGSVHGEDIRR